jgi:hypothetical protein
MIVKISKSKVSPKKKFARAGWMYNIEFYGDIASVPGSP